MHSLTRVYRDKRLLDDGRPAPGASDVAYEGEAKTAHSMNTYESGQVLTADPIGRLWHDMAWWRRRRRHILCGCSDERGVDCFQTDSARAYDGAIILPGGRHSITSPPTNVTQTPTTSPAEVTVTRFTQYLFWEWLGRPPQSLRRGSVASQPHLPPCSLPASKHSTALPALSECKT
jgi:hypothetical protein